MAECFMTSQDHHHARLSNHKRCHAASQRICTAIVKERQRMYRLSNSVTRYARRDGFDAFGRTGFATCHPLRNKIVQAVMVLGAREVGTFAHSLLHVFHASAWCLTPELAWYSE